MNAVFKVLPIDERKVYEASLTAPGMPAAYPCIISSYPVLRSLMEFPYGKKVANKEDWNRFIMAAKMTGGSDAQDVLKFINKWAGGVPNLSYSFQ